MQKNNKTPKDPNLWRQSRPELNGIPIKSSNYKKENSSKYPKRNNNGNHFTERKSEHQSQSIAAVESSLNHKSPLKESDTQSVDDIIPYASRIKISLSDFQKKKSHFEKKQQHSQQWRLKNKHMRYENYSDNHHYSTNDKYVFETIEIPELRSEETDVETSNNPSLLNSTNDSTTVIMSANNESLGSLPTNDIGIIKPDLECVSDESEGSGNLKKLEMMTAIDFNRDRYARFEIHESEMKDYVRTITYKNCLEYCSEQYIEVNIYYLADTFIGNLINSKNNRYLKIIQFYCVQYIGS